MQNKTVQESQSIFLCVLCPAGNTSLNTLNSFFNKERYSLFRFETSKRLISHDIHSNIYNYKYTTVVEIVPVCKVRHFKAISMVFNAILQDDIVCLSKKQSKQLGNIGPLCICSRVTQNVYLIDPGTLKGKNKVRDSSEFSYEMTFQLHLSQRMTTGDRHLLLYVILNIQLNTLSAMSMHSMQIRNHMFMEKSHKRFEVHIFPIDSKKSQMLIFFCLARIG